MEKSDETPTPTAEEIVEVAEASVESDEACQGPSSTSQEAGAADQPPTKKARGKSLPEKNNRKNEFSIRTCGKIVQNLEKMNRLFNTAENPNRFQYYFKAKYIHVKEKGKEKVDTYNAGVNYGDSEPHPTSAYATTAQLQEGLDQVRREMATQSLGLKQMNETTPTKATNASTSSSPAIFPSPVSTAVVPQKSSCMNQNCSFPDSDAWIGCFVEKCGYWVHAKCHGFPLVTESDVMPTFYCPLHLI